MGDSRQPTAEDELVNHLLTRTIDLPILASAVEQQEAADAADTIERLQEDERAELLEQMDEQPAADALAEMLPPLASGVLEDLLEEDREKAVRLLTLMAPDDAADLLQLLNDGARETLFGLMSVDESRLLRRLVGYDTESAGGLMTTDFPSLRSGMTVTEAIDLIRQAEIPDELNELPVTSAEGKLVGIIGLRELLLGRPDDRIAALMAEGVRAARVDMDREQVAHEFDRYDHSMLPVLDDQERLLGVVTVDDVIDIIRAEQTEDVQKTVGAGAGEAVYSSFGEKLRGRFPWLGVSLVLSGFAALVVILFQRLISEMPILAYLMPVIAALVGNAGHQALAVTLRGVVLNEVRSGHVVPLIGKEMIVGVVNGAVLGLFICAGVSIMSQWVASASLRVGVIAGIATTIAMGVGTLAGTAVPLIMRRFGVDPAHSSAIFLIMITDAVSFSVLLGLTVVLSEEM